MSKFTIYSASGDALYTGTPTYTGSYRKPGMLEFRDVSVPEYIEFAPGCYVDYTRTGYRYRLYTTPQLKKQARSSTYGGAFVYQGVQLFDASKMLEYCPFRDLVKGDNRIHFSTQPSISTFEGCDGLASRFEACLRDQYDVNGAQSWAVRIATVAGDGISQDLADLMAEPRDFSVSGVNILECLDKIYEVWPGVGWVFKVEMVDGSPVDTIVIGGGEVLTNPGIYAYGRGNGLTSLTRTAANADEIANRIFAYGSSRNMLPRWYNGQDIKDAESVDIPNLMIPITEWGETDGLHDAAKAYVENAESIAKNGLRPSTVYFDGSGEYPEIYPTLRETTIDMVRTALDDSTAKYYPRTDIYTDPSQRIDTIMSAPESFDSGLSGDSAGKTNVDSEYTGINESENTSFPAGYAAKSVFTYQGIYTPSVSGNFSISLGLNISGSITLADIKSVNVLAGISESGTGGISILSEAKSIDVEPGAVSVSLHNLSFNANRVSIQSGVSYNVAFVISVEAERSELDRPCLVRITGGYSISLANYRTKTFTVGVRQVGFDINEQAGLGDGKTIAMRTGKCAGRSFAIKSVQYDSTTDSWSLECWRTEDESLSQWFPNTDFPVRGLENAGESDEYPGDEFVLLDLAMPDIYVRMAEQKLLTAAQDLLADTATERWQYAPEIDAKYMVENGRNIHPGEYLVLRDGDIFGDTTESILVDTVTINEGESAIPTYKVTLRDRKKKTWTESKGAEPQSSKSVGNITEQQQSSQSFESQYFTLDENGNVTLKPQYENLWVPGWLAAGGIGTDGGGGGGGLIQTVYTVSDLGTIGFESVTETFSAYAIDSIFKGSGASLSLTTVSTTSYLKDSLGNYLLDSDGKRLALPGSSSSTRLNLLNGAGTVLSSVDLDLDLSAYVPTSRKINGHALTSDVTLSATADLGVAAWAMGGTGSTIPFSILPLMYVARTQVAGEPGNATLLGVDAISHDSISGDSDASRIEWVPDAGGVGVGAWRVKGNLYVDGWLAAAGIGDANGSGGGGGGGGTSSVIYMNDLRDVTAPNPGTNDILIWNPNGGWVNTPKAMFLSGYLQPSQLRTINSTSLIGVGDITINDGKSAYEIWLDEGHSGTEADFLASLQGNSGYQGAAGELQIVNNYTDGGATAALSAEMGKQLYAILTALDASGYKIVGIATPSTNPTTPAYKVAYLAGAGTYPYFGDLTVGYNELALLIYSGGNWVKVSTDIKVSKQVDELLYRIAKTNFYNPYDTDIVTGYYLDASGDLVENANYLVTGYIPFTASMGKMIPSVAGNDMSGAGGYLVLYDSDKQVVATYQENEVNGIATWEDGVSYVRFSIMGPQRGAIQIEVGEVITTYMPFGTVFIADDVVINGSTLADGTVLGEKIAAGSVSPEKCTFFKSNLFDPEDEDVAEGYYLDNGGNLQSNAAWLATGYIPFASGKMCASVDGTDASGGGYIVLYDRNKTRVASYQSSLSHNVATWEDNVAYVRFSLYDYTRGKIQVEPGDTPTDFVEYGKPILAPEYSSTSPMVDSILGEDASRVVSASVTDGQAVSITNFPYHIKKGLCMSASADITTFNTIYVGKGYQQYRGDWLKIDGTNIVLQHYESSVSDVETIAHGLAISTFVRVSMSSDAGGKLHVVLGTFGGVFQCEFDNFGYEANYAPFIRSAGTSMTNVVLTAGNTDFRCPVWACGDSYFGVYEARWPGWMKEFGYFNFLINGLAGQSSAGAYSDLRRMLSFGTPKYLLWCLGMNDTDSVFVENFEKVKALCSQKGITLIGATVPTVPTRDKEYITTYVRSSGVRYIDFYKAVGANSSGNWYYGYLDSDGVHPSIAGAKALATQVLVDFPELMQYGLTV